MTQNIGSLDRIVRTVIGIALIAATLTGAIGVWGWIGVVPLVTALMGWCPPYAILGFSTCSVKK
jgi:membrane protein implicated in regulation of membrane protease activity